MTVAVALQGAVKGKPSIVGLLWERLEGLSLHVHVCSRLGNPKMQQSLQQTKAVMLAKQQQIALS